MDDAHEDLRHQLESISEDLGDRILVVLAEAVQAGATGRPAEEKLLSRARSAVDKAVALLGQIEAAPDV